MADALEVFEEDVVVPTRPIVLRGGGAFIWNVYSRAIDDAIPPPAEIMLIGRAGTGKSMGALAAHISVCKVFHRLPGRGLIIRLTRKSLTTSACATIRKILAPNDPALIGPADDYRSSYAIGNWRVSLGTLDNIDNYLSAEWDWIFLDEARQASKEQWELLAGRGVRNNVFFHHDFMGNRVKPGTGVSRIPFGLCTGATNPWSPKTWFIVRAGKPSEPGPLTLIRTTLEENPGFTDIDERGVLTINYEGRAYDERMRATNSGTRFRRLVLGESCSAEGLIYEEWEGDPAKINEPDSNLVRWPRDSDGWMTLDELGTRDVREFYVGVDFGDSAPGALVLAGLTGQRHLVVIAEAYARKKDPSWWRDRVVEINRRYPITLGFCDHNRPDMVRLFNECIGAPKDGPGAIFVPADKGVDRGIAIMRMRIKDRTLKFDVDSLIHPPDPLCLADGIPYQTVDEIPDYVHKRDDDDDLASSEKREDRPDPKCHDHGCDATRYLCVGVENMEPDRKMRRPVEASRARYLKGLYEIPVAGLADEETLALDIQEMQDEEADLMQDMLERLRGGRRGDDE